VLYLAAIARGAYNEGELVYDGIEKSHLAIMPSRQLSNTWFTGCLP
jgi:hypothetical protein